MKEETKEEAMSRQIKEALSKVEGLKDFSIYISTNGRISVKGEAKVEPNEVIKDITEAVEYIRTFRNYNIDSDTSSQLLFRPNMNQLKALDKLMFIAKAWNLADDFIPDTTNIEQKRWKPIFCYKNGSFSFVEAITDNYNYLFSNVGLSFKTKQRATQFAIQFIDLWDDYFIGDYRYKLKKSEESCGELITD